MLGQLLVLLLTLLLKGLMLNSCSLFLFFSFFFSPFRLIS